MEFLFSLLHAAWFLAYGFPFALVKVLFPIVWPLTLLYILRNVVFSKTKYLSAQDSVLVSGDPDCLLTIHVACKLDRRIDPNSIRHSMLKRFACHTEARQRLVRRQWLWHYWEEDGTFDINNHVFFEQLPGKAGHKEFEEFVSAKLRQPLKLAHPLWEQYVLTNFVKDDGTVARLCVCVCLSCACGGVGMAVLH